MWNRCLYPVKRADHCKKSNSAVKIGGGDQLFYLYTVKIGNFCQMLMSSLTLHFDIMISWIEYSICNAILQLFKFGKVSTKLLKVSQL